MKESLCSHIPALFGPCWPCLFLPPPDGPRLSADRSTAQCAIPPGPPFPAQAVRDREGVRKAAAVMRSIAPGRLFAAGHSYGGRQSAMAAAEDPTMADGLVLFSYPLHPPRKPEQLRTGFFSELRTPALFVHGTLDPFGSIDELRAQIAAIPARTDVLAVEGAAHDLKRAPGLAGEIVERMLF